MKVLLIKDVYKHGRAGDVKKVADGYGRSYLLPQGYAVLATPGAIKQAEYIRAKASVTRTELNNAMEGVSGKINGAVLYFPSKAGETGKLYGSITNQMIAEALSKKSGIEIDKRQIEAEPIRMLGEHKAHVRLTIDLVPEIKIVVHREGEKVEPEGAQPAAPVAEAEKVEATTEEQAE